MNKLINKHAGEEDESGLEREYVCEVCDATGTVDCEECNGSGMDEEGETCDACNGDGSVDCPECV